MKRDRPVLVTGAHRSGTTWLGGLLASPLRLQYVDEPFHAGPGGRGLPWKIGARRFYLHVDESNEAAYAPAMERIVRLDGFVEHGMRSLARNPRSLVNVGKGLVLACLASGLHGGVLLKDPYALFSAEWMAERFDARVILMVRHPAGFASSQVRVQWDIDFRHLTEQRALRDGILAPYEERIREFSGNGVSLLEKAALMWVLLNAQVSRLKERHPDWIFIRHEDVAWDPVHVVGDLLGRLGYPTDGFTGWRVRRQCRGRVKAEPPKGQSHMKGRDSKSVIGSWKRRLDPSEVDRIRAIVEPESSEFYSDRDW